VVVVVTFPCAGLTQVRFGLANNFGHHLDRFNGVLAGGGFGGEHDGVGAVVDGVGDVGSLGAGGARVLDHRLEHWGR